MEDRLAQLLVILLLMGGSAAVLLAKESFEPGTQEVGLIAFYFGFIVDTVRTLILVFGGKTSYSWTTHQTLYIYTIPLCLLLYSYIFMMTLTIAKLMRDRERLVKSESNLNQELIV